VAKLSRQERVDIAKTRLLRILGKHQIAHMRTLEMKISDAGPFDQRIDPHILTEARNELVLAGEIQVHQAAPHRPPWYYLGNTQFATVQARLQQLETLQQAFSQQAVTSRTGQALEIAVYRTLADAGGIYFGDYTDLDAHDDSTLYSKKEPPNHLGNNRIPGDKLLDFLVSVGGDWAGIECKNIREWIYPEREEVKDLLFKAVSLDCVPVLIARRIHASTFLLLNKCGLIIHQTYNQRIASADAALAEQARDKDSLAYFDIKVGNEADARLTKFITESLPAALPAARAKYDQYFDLLWQYADNQIDYENFAARVRRRSQGVNEDFDPD